MVPVSHGRPSWFSSLFCGLDSPVCCLTCFLFYFEGPSCPRLGKLHFPPVHLPDCLHLPLVSPSVYLSPVFPFVFVAWSSSVRNPCVECFWNKEPLGLAPAFVSSLREPWQQLVLLIQ